jgi:acetyltransferase
MTHELTVTGTLRIRPIQAADLQPLKSFMHELSPGTLYFRFGRLSMPVWSEAHWHSLCSPDSSKAAHFIATHVKQPGQYSIIGMARLVLHADSEQAEFSIVLADQMQGHGIGTQLMQALVGEARRLGLNSIYGDVLPSNQSMLSFCKGLGFASHACPDDDRLYRMVLNIKPALQARSHACNSPAENHLLARQMG